MKTALPRRENGFLRMSNSELLWNLRISRSATVPEVEVNSSRVLPGLWRLGFFTPAGPRKVSIFLAALSFGVFLAAWSVLAPVETVLVDFPPVFSAEDPPVDFLAV